MPSWQQQDVTWKAVQRPQPRASTVAPSLSLSAMRSDLTPSLRKLLSIFSKSMDDFFFLQEIW